MELKKKAFVVKVALLLFLLGFIATVDACFDPSSLITKVLPNGDDNYYVKSITTACYNNCICTKSNPPQCYCADVGDTCHSACNLYVCPRSLFPLKCKCADITDFCYPKCNSSEAEAH